MKQKNFMTAIVLTALLLLTAGCSAEENNRSGSDVTVQSVAPSVSVEGEHDLESIPAEPQREDISLPEEFRITYEIENGDGTLSLITLAQNADGEFYYQNASEEKWFLPQGNGYIQAMPDESGELVPISSGIILKDTAFREHTVDFWNCAETSEKRFAPGFEWEGTETVAGRNCDLYTNYLGVANMNVTYLLYIDQETGICLGWQEDAETGIFDTQPAKGTFLCSEFATGSGF